MAGLDSHEDVSRVAINFVNWILEVMGRPYWEESSMTKALAPPKRQELWHKLNLFPGGGFSEIVLVQTNESNS